MAVDSENVELQFNMVVADLAIDVDIKCYDKTSVFVYYGNARNLATQDYHYTVELDEDSGFEQFKVTPLLQLLDDIAAMIVANPTEDNTIFVRRRVDYKSDFEATFAFLREKIVKEFDLTVMRMQQLAADFALVTNLNDLLTLMNNAVATTVGNAILTAADRVASANSAAAAAASALSVNAANLLTKVGNLSGIADIFVARANIGLGTTYPATTGNRLANTASHAGVLDMNSLLESGWYSPTGVVLANSPPNSTGLNTWLVEVIAHASTWVTQIAYEFIAAGSTDQVFVWRRHSYDSGGVRAWRAWHRVQHTQIGTIIWTPFSTPPVGTVKANGALLSRTTYAALWVAAQASGNIDTDANWTSSKWGGFSTGDLSTTFRIPDIRGEFIRGFDDSRGADSGRALGTRQLEDFKAHTHPVTGNGLGSAAALQGGGINSGQTLVGLSATSTGGTETRPRNVALLACIVY